MIKPDIEILYDCFNNADLSDYDETPKFADSNP